jgi:quercetin dioxygenase-like cupin family protein/mannose-6-phosphate isomerase-like protein (cupin superfamily)
MNAPSDKSVPAVRIINVADIKPTNTPHRQTVLQTAEFEDPRDGRRFRCGFSRKKQDSNYSPPHRHTFDQIRFVIDGKTKYGPMRLASGECAYFPEGVFYGPTEPLSEEIASCTIQSQGPSWGAFPNDAECLVAGQQLKDKGQMDRATGQFIWADGRKQDSFEALLETLQGGPVEYPEQRYRAPVQLKTEAFDWIPSKADRGVQLKPLARFNAAGPDIGMVRIEAGAALSGDVENTHRMMVVFSGEGTHGAETLREGSFIYCPPGVKLADIRAEEPTLVFVTKFESRVA